MCRALSIKDGFILSSIYSRDDCRVYANPVDKGESEYVLNDEENRVLDIVLKGASI